jgi:hypothetical protein
VCVYKYTVRVQTRSLLGKAGLSACSASAAEQQMAGFVKKCVGAVCLERREASCRLSQNSPVAFGAEA